MSPVCVKDGLADLLATLHRTYTESELDRIASALQMTPCDPSTTLILGIFETLHASCERGWRGDLLVSPPWKDRTG